MPALKVGRARDSFSVLMALKWMLRDLSTIDVASKLLTKCRPVQGEAILRKTAASAFWGTPLVAHLSANRVDTVIVCGETTSGCIRATVVDARMNRYNVIVPEEGVFDRHEAPHAINLFDMHQKHADVIPVTDVLAHLSSLTSYVERP